MSATNRRWNGAVGALLALLLSAVTLSVAHPAAAASALAPIDPGGFKMRAGNFTDPPASNSPSIKSCSQPGVTPGSSG
ncbi:hypothetical protein ACWGDT_13050 [Streptomyces avermitilis]